MNAYLPRRLYMDNAATSRPKPDSVMSAMAPKVEDSPKTPTFKSDYVMCDIQSLDESGDEKFIFCCFRAL